MKDDPIIDMEILPDGTVRFEVSGVPGAKCEDIERLVVEALRGKVVARVHTPAFHVRADAGVLGRVKALLGKK